MTHPERLVVVPHGSSDRRAYSSSRAHPPADRRGTTAETRAHDEVSQGCLLPAGTPCNGHPEQSATHNLRPCSPLREKLPGTRPRRRTDDTDADAGARPVVGTVRARTGKQRPSPQRDNSPIRTNGKGPRGGRPTDPSELQRHPASTPAKNPGRRRVAKPVW